jgi:predicted nucleic acid-binding Zn ribbon protein
MNDKGEIIGRFAVGDSWDDIDNPFVVEEIREDPEEKRNRERAYARMERNKRRARRRAFFFAVLAIILLVALVVLAIFADTPMNDIVIPAEAAEVTEKPESEETTMHVIAPDWDELMVRAVLDGNESQGADCVEIGGLHYTYDDLYLLAKIIREEDGADDDGHEWPDMPIIALANVVLHRVRSPLFPNTVREVIYQEGPGSTVQYAPVHTSYWEETEPVERYVRLAQRALNGEEVIGEEVIYQALFPQGRVTVMTWYDEYLNTTTYFCEG